MLETIAISVPKADFKEFMLSDLAALLFHIHQQSQKVFLPTSVSASVSAPDRDIMILMRNMTTINQKNGPYQLRKGRVFTPAEFPKLSQRFILRTVDFTSQGSSLKKIKAALFEDILSTVRQ